MEYQSGNIFFRPNPLDKDDVCGGHKHNFDHTTFVIKGSVRIVTSDDTGTVLWQKTFKAGQWVLIKAELLHEITGLEDNSEFVCVYSHRTPQGEVCVEYNGFDDAYF
jgi:quercetin dioxygenase-like cupin family protein